MFAHFGVNSKLTPLHELRAWQREFGDDTQFYLVSIVIATELSSLGLPWIHFFLV
jgi:hypothetical protein